MRNFCKLIGLNRAAEFQPNLEYLHVKITKPLRFKWCKQIMICGDIWHKLIPLVIFQNCLKFHLPIMACEITYNNFEISLMVYVPNINTNHAI